MAINNFIKLCYIFYNNVNKLSNEINLLVKMNLKPLFKCRNILKSHYLFFISFKIDTILRPMMKYMMMGALLTSHYIEANKCISKNVYVEGEVRVD